MEAEMDAAKKRFFPVVLPGGVRESFKETEVV